MISETMCHHTESMNSLIRCFYLVYHFLFSVIGIGKRGWYMYVTERERESSSVPISSEWIDLDPPPSQLFLQFVTVLLYTGFPLEQMWPSTVVWPLRYFMLNRHKVTCVSYLKEWALLFFMLVTSTNSHRYKTKSKF